MEDVQQRLSTLAKDVEGKTQLLHDSEIVFTQKDELYKHTQEDLVLYTAELDEITQELSKLRAKKAAIENSLAIYSSEESTSGVASSKTVDRPNNMIDSLREKRDEVSNQITQIKVDIATLNAQNKSISVEIERILGEQEELSLSMDEDNQQIQTM